jgi:dGTPase
VINDEFAPEERPTLEASLVDKADELAYSAHDIDDGLSSGLISLDDLQSLSIWDCEPNPFEAEGGTSESGSDELRYHLVRFLINLLATDLLQATRRRLDDLGVTDLASLRATPEPVCLYSDETAVRLTELKQFLMNELYRHERLLALADRAAGIVRFLYRKLLDNPALMPERFQAMLNSEEPEIVAADYLAGMTDRFAERLAEDLV